MAMKSTPTAMTKTFFHGKISFFFSFFIPTEEDSRRDKLFHGAGIGCSRVPGRPGNPHGMRGTAKETPGNHRVFTLPMTIGNPGISSHILKNER